MLHCGSNAKLVLLLHEELLLLLVLLVLLVEVLRNGLQVLHGVRVPALRVVQLVLARLIEELLLLLLLLLLILLMLVLVLRRVLAGFKLGMNLELGMMLRR